MTGGWTFWTDGEGHTAVVTHLYGFDKDFFGSMNPTTTSNGKPYEALYDQHVHDHRLWCE
jgi:hypothetical protein